jgi:hypothetical protein
MFLFPVSKGNGRSSRYNRKLAAVVAGYRRNPPVWAIFQLYLGILPLPVDWRLTSGNKAVIVKNTGQSFRVP